MKPCKIDICIRSLLISFLALISADRLAAVPTPEPRSDVSNKALITKEKPPVKAESITSKSASTEAAALRKMAEEYYTWQNEQFPVGSSNAGLHTWDNKLADYSPAKIAERAQHVRSVLE